MASLQNIKGKLLVSLPFLLQVTIKILALSLGIFTTRWVNINFSISERANLETVFSISALMLAVIGFGTPNIIYKLYLNKDKYVGSLASYWSTINLFRVICFIVSLPIIYLIGSMWGVSNWLFLYGVYTVQFILELDLHFKSISDTNGRAVYYSISDFLSKAIIVILLYGGIYLLPRNVIEIYVFVYAIANLGTVFLDMYFQRASVKWGVIKWGLLKNLRSELSVMFLSNIVMAIYLRTLPLFLKGYSDNIIASYGNSQKVFDLWSVIPAITVPVIVAKMVNQLKELENSNSESDTKNNQQKRDQILKKNILICLGFGVSLAVVSVITYPIISVLVGLEKYTLTRNFYLIQVFGLTIFPLLYFFGNYFLFLNKEKYQLVAAISTAILTIGSILILNHYLGYFGAIIGLTLGYIFEFLIKLILFIRQEKSL